jgi:hypothetical protein
MRQILDSSFPDSERIRNLLIELRYVPPHLRGQLWALLLCGRVEEDTEAIGYRAVDDWEIVDDVKGSEYMNRSQLAADCEAILCRGTNNITIDRENDTNETDTGLGLELGLNSSSGGGSCSVWGDPQSMRRNLIDLLSFYCERRQVDYNHLYCHLLAPMFAPPAPLTRGIASTCFYALATEFVPLVNLKPGAQEASFEVVHFWLRLLVAYHSPALQQHLDRVLPGWEQPLEQTSIADAAIIAEQHKTSVELDNLERELGLDDGGPSASVASESTWRSTAGDLLGDANGSTGGGGGAMESGVQSAVAGQRQSGCVPSQWILGFFSGSLPPAQACLLMDWAIIHNERFAGVYYCAALLEIYSETLLAMPGNHIRSWLSDIASGKQDWYLAIDLPHDDALSGAKPSWTTFVNGWIHATAGELSLPLRT